MEEAPIINRVANSPLVSLDLEEYIPKVERFSLDLADFLFQRMLLKEKDFRQALKNYDFGILKDKAVRIYCSEDAIIPSWAYMLLSSYLQGVVYTFTAGNMDDLEKSIIDRAIADIPIVDFENKKIVIKGCGDVSIRDYAYIQISKRLLPHVNSLMYGEPCSTVPVFKKKK